MPGYKYIDGIRDALTYQMGSDERVVVIGIDVGRPGGPYTVTRGLYERFGPERVFDTPIVEMSFMGAGVGAALGGLRPMVELMYLDFLGSCLEPLLNQAAKIRYMSNGALSVPLVVRTQVGGPGSSAAQHSQHLEALLAHIPGMKVVMPAFAADAYGLLNAAFADPNPTIYIENRTLYRHRSGEQPPEGHVVPLGSANVVREGRDITLMSYSRAAHQCLEAALLLERDSIDAELIDLRSLVPLDFETIAASVRKTSRAVVVHDAVEPFGIGAEIAARISEELFDWLDAPVARVGALATPVPFAPNLEAAYLPDAERVAARVREVCAGSGVPAAA